jgi:hypothetical protein
MHYDPRDGDPVDYSVHILGGGTVFHVRPHLALSAPAYGNTARAIKWQLLRRHSICGKLHLTRMCPGGDTSSTAKPAVAPRTDRPETNEDVANLLDHLVANPHTKIIFMSMALCDFTAKIVKREFDGVDIATTYEVSGKMEPRLKTSDGQQSLLLTPADKLIGRIRKDRKDIFLVGFKTTAGAPPDAQYLAGLSLLKTASCNLVFANDLHTRRCMVITPEQARYHECTVRSEAMAGLVDMALLRSKLTFTRSEVRPGDPVAWSDSRVPSSLRTVVEHCIARGAYKPVHGATVGHFAVKLDDSTFLTSRRKTDFNTLAKTGLVLVEAHGDHDVVAYGSKPSVGGQSQRIVFRDHPDTDCIVHFHCPTRRTSVVPVRSQRAYECGSHECGKNTSDGLQPFGGVYAVMLDKHGPNIVFHRDTDPATVIAFIEENFDLQDRTDEVTDGQALQGMA